MKKTKRPRRPRPPHKTIPQHNAELRLKAEQEAARRRTAKENRLREIIREAAHTGMVAAIEHCQNFWSVSDGYRRYIKAEIAEQTEIMKIAMHEVLREVLAPKRKRGRPRKQSK